MPVAVLGEVGDLPLHPEPLERALDHELRRLVEIGDRDGVLGGLSGRAHEAAQPAIERRAARAVFDSNIAIVIRPTPPGTGEMREATALTSSNFTSPTMR